MSCVHASGPIPATLAVSDYDHVRDLRAGVVSAPGLALTVLDLEVEEIFHRVTAFREWEVSEMSFGRYVSLLAGGETGLVGIPVFPSRMFRHSAFYARAGSGIDGLAGLRGRRVGVPEWAQTAGIWARGLLSREYGVGLDEVEWVQGGVHEPGRREQAPVKLPAKVRVRVEHERSLSDLLLAGELDAVISARAPLGFEEGGVRRLVPDFLAVEQAYFAATAILPIMHLIVLRRDFYERHRWAAVNLLGAFEAAKRRSLRRVRDLTTSYLPIPWGAATAAALIDRFGGDDPWPYGLAPNRMAVAAFLEAAHQQGVCERRLRPEELFAPETLDLHRV